MNPLRTENQKAEAVSKQKSNIREDQADLTDELLDYSKWNYISISKSNSYNFILKQRF